jgi:cell division protein FtsN
MLILLKTTVRTSIFILLFTIGVSFLFYSSEVLATTNLTGFNNQETIISGDTVITLNSNINADIVIPKDLAEKTIDFQVNSTIVYLNIRQFRKVDSKKIFIQAWTKEKELDQLKLKTDSLRKIYSSASDDQKEGLAVKILQDEQHAIELNEEIPAFYEKISKLENDYWQSASADELSKFQESVNSYKDSLRQTTEAQNKKSVEEAEQVSDTISIFQPIEKVDLKTENSPSISYKIQIGAYKGKVPDSAAKLIKKLSLIRKIEKNKDEKGMTVYTTGNLKAYQEAVTMQNQVKQEGVKNATIIAFQNGKKISIDEARKINKEQ